MSEDDSDLEAIRVTMVARADAGNRLRNAVTTARANGHSWEKIGVVLGVSKQAAQERFG